MKLVQERIIIVVVVVVVLAVAKRRLLGRRVPLRQTIRVFLGTTTITK